MAPRTRKATKTTRSQSFANISDATIRKILTSTRTIALVGASDKVERPSNEVMGILQEYGYRVIPINPRLKGQVLLGERVLGSLEELPEVLGKVRAGIETKEDDDDDKDKQELPSSPNSQYDGAGGVMVDIFRHSDSAGEVVDQAIALGGNLISSIWMQIGVVDDNAAQRAVDAGFSVAMNVCPAEEIPRLGISVPIMTRRTEDDEDAHAQDNKKSNSKRHHTNGDHDDLSGSKTVSSSAKRRRT
jgi:predicted CoA-binding protein